MIKTVHPWVDNIYSIYLAVVCAISLLFMVYFAASLLNTTVDTFFPYEFEKSSPLQEPAPAPDFNEAPQLNTFDLVPIPEEETTKDDEMRRQLHNMKRELLHNIINLFLTSLVFIFHWHFLRKHLKGVK